MLDLHRDPKRSRKASWMREQGEAAVVEELKIQRKKPGIVLRRIKIRPP